MRSTAARLALSTFAGVITFYAIAFVLKLGIGASELADRYCDVFGLATAMARLADREYNPPEEMVSVIGDRIAFITMISIWTLVFGFLYFRFVFRPGPKT